MNIVNIISVLGKKFLTDTCKLDIVSEQSQERGFKSQELFNEQMFCIAFSGNENFVLAVDAEEMVLKSIAYSFTRDHEMYDDEIGLDSLKEFLNIIAGHILGELINAHNSKHIGISTPFLLSDELISFYKKCYEIRLSSNNGDVILFCFR